MSNEIEALIASMIASGPAAKRPPHMAFEEFVSSVIVRPFVGGIMLRLFVLYTALALCANAAPAADLSALKQGEMKKLAVFTEPLALPEIPFVDETGTSHRLADYRGKVVLFEPLGDLVCALPQGNARYRGASGRDRRG
ncbi:hypothetical protein ACTTAL_16380 [Rhodobacter capsulatus]|uniref:hypothetical protein n=1 Tax=Rhodobacter capsulatus TaxID=1061 RepID=UPI004038AFB8